MHPTEMIDAIYQNSLKFSRLPAEVLFPWYTCEELVRNWESLSRETQQQFAEKVGELLPVYFPKYADLPPEELSVENFKYECFKQRISTDMNRFFDLHFPQLVNAFHITNLYVAGGSILRVIHKGERTRHFSNHVINDVDIYTTKNRATAFLGRLRAFQSEEIVCTVKFIYSGIADNPQNILCHIEIVFPYSTGVRIDLVIVSQLPGQSEVEAIRNAIDNFDLTFCQVGVFWNGVAWETALRKNRFEDVSRMRGTLIGNFVAEFASGNKVTHNRIQKYLKRGYEISLPALTLTNPLNHNVMVNNRSVLTYGQRVFRRIICMYLYKVADAAWYLHHTDNTYTNLKRLESYCYGYTKWNDLDANGKNFLRAVEILITRDNFNNSTRDIPAHMTWDQLVQTTDFRSEVRPLEQYNAHVTLKTYFSLMYSIFPRKWRLILQNGSAFLEMLNIQGRQLSPFVQDYLRSELGFVF